MKLPQHIFALTKNEQRVIILILMALLAGAVANYYRRAQSRVAVPSEIESSNAPAANSPATEEPSADD